MNGEIYFDRLTGGMRRDAERMSRSPETYPEVWYDLKNLIPYRGMLQRREGVIAPSSAIFPPDGPSDDWVILIASILYVDNQDRFIVVTTRDIWIGDSGGVQDPIFYCVTPIYTEAGGLSVTNGSPNVSAAGAAWVSSRIAPGQPIKINGVWYTIATVPSETTLTLDDNYAGATNTGVTYEIRRTFSGTVTRPFAAVRMLNGDAIVVVKDGGYYQNTATMEIESGTAVVLSISRAGDPRKGTFSGADTTILASTDAMDPGTDFWDEVIIPKGMEILEDGRIVLACHAQNKEGDVDLYGIYNQILFSSHLDPAVWMTDPGGFYFLIERRGGITGMRRMGGLLTVHFNDMIMLGQATGADSDPISWRPSRASVGAVGPRLLVDVPSSERFPRGQFFLAGDLHTYIFDGDDAVPIPTGWDALIRDAPLDPIPGAPLSIIAAEGHLCFDEYRTSVSLFSSTEGVISGGASRELRVDLDTGVVHRHRWKTFISACSEQRMFGPTSSAATGAFDTRILGTRGTDHSGAATKYLYRNALRVLNDSALPSVIEGTLTDGFLAESHDLVLGRVDMEGRILCAILWFTGRAAVTETIQCSLSVDSGYTWELGVGNNSIALADTVAERRVVFYFSTSAPAERARIRLHSPNDDVFSFALTRMWLGYAQVSSVRAVP